MEKYDNLIWGFIFSIIGITFGWGLNQASQWFSTIQQDKRSLKVVLYNLLEVYFLFSKSDIDKFVEMITRQVLIRVPENEQTQEVEKFLQQLYLNFAEKYLRPDLLDDLDKIERDYQNSIKELASIDPITAYRLSGKSKILDRLEDMSDILEEFKQMYPSEAEEIETGTKAVVQVTRKQMLKDLLNDLEDDIRKIAWKISIMEWWRVKKTVKNIKENVEKTVQEKIGSLFDEIGESMGQ